MESKGVYEVYQSSWYHCQFPVELVWLGCYKESYVADSKLESSVPVRPLTADGRLWWISHRYQTAEKSTFYYFIRFSCITLTLSMLGLVNNSFCDWLLCKSFKTLLLTVWQLWGNNEIFLHNLLSASKVFPHRRDHEKCKVFKMTLYAGCRKAL